jgi:uncharacterized delta-60 repeat protein
MKTKTTLPLFLMLNLIQQYSSQAQNLIPDSLFAGTGILEVNTGTDEERPQLLLQADGKIICAGYDVASGSPNTWHDMVRFDVCGAIDSTFGVNGIVRNAFIAHHNKANDYVLQQDGKILVAGMSATANAGSLNIPHVSRYNTDGTPDTSFSGNGSIEERFDLVSSGEFHSVYQLADGRITAIGNCQTNINGGVNGAGIMRFHSNGAFDNTFDGDAKIVYPIANSTSAIRGHILQNGNIITTMSRNIGGNDIRFSAMCFDSTGTQVTTFGSSGEFTSGTSLGTLLNPVAAALQPDEKIVMATNNGPFPYSLTAMRLLPNGSMDTTFGINGYFTYPTNSSIGSVNRVRILNSGKILFAGHVSPSGPDFAYLIRVNSNGTLDSTFGSNGILLTDFNGSAFNVSAGDVLELSNGQLLLAGDELNFFVERFIDQNNVPHISALWQNGTVMQTTGTGTYQWYLNGTPVSGSTSDTLNATQNGTYTVELTDLFGCRIMSDTFNLTNVGIVEAHSPAGVNAFPNPFTDEITITINDNQSAEVIVFDITSRKLLQIRFANTVSLNTSALHSGIYFYEIRKNDGSVITGKVIRD